MKGNPMSRPKEMQKKRFDSSPSQEEVIEVARKMVPELWKSTATQPEANIESLGKVTFVAGGGLVLQFGDKDSKVWEAITQAADNETHDIQIAGINFTLDQLSHLGDFYRWLADRDYVMHCIDERLNESAEHHDKQVHCKCGACAAVQVATSLEDVENIVMAELGMSPEDINEEAKQPLLKDMPDHASMAISVDYSGEGRALAQNRRNAFKADNALAFNVSIPVALLEEYVSTTVGVDSYELIDTMVKWNVQIARNIIGGDHNVLQEAGDDTIMIIDKRDIEMTSVASDIVGTTEELMSKIVTPDKQIAIQ